METIEEINKRATKDNLLYFGTLAIGMLICGSGTETLSNQNLLVVIGCFFMLSSWFVMAYIENRARYIKKIIEQK